MKEYGGAMKMRKLIAITHWNMDENCFFSGLGMAWGCLETEQTPASTNICPCCFRSASQHGKRSNLWVDKAPNKSCALSSWQSSSWATQSEPSQGGWCRRPERRAHSIQTSNKDGMGWHWMISNISLIFLDYPCMYEQLYNLAVGCQNFEIWKKWSKSLKQIGFC